MKSVVFLVGTNFEETNYREETVFGLKNDTKRAFRHKVDIKSTQARILILLVLREICVDMSILNLLFKKKNIILCIKIYIYNKGKKKSTQRHFIKSVLYISGMVLLIMFQPPYAMMVGYELLLKHKVFALHLLLLTIEINWNEQLD